MDEMRARDAPDQDADDTARMTGWITGGFPIPANVAEWRRAF